ncbi:MAG: carbamoyltransferase [Candidatus Omnitrophota bacterium]|jgi:carbamoyltransferase
MKVLGVSCFYHDSAACLISDGKIVAAAQEERFNRRKNSPDFPINAINYCLQQDSASVYDIDYIGFYEKPFLKFSRVIVSHLQSFPFSLRNFIDTVPHWLADRLIMPLVFKRELGFEGKVLFIPHHMSHAASAFFSSGFNEAAILTVDGVGEWASVTCGVGKGNQITINKELRFPHSLGLLYTAVTTFLGFQALEGEGTVMGLAALGKPAYVDKFKSIISLKQDGSFHLDMRYFGFFNEGRMMYTQRFVRAFGSPRLPGGKLEERHCDIACSLQAVTEEALVNLACGLYHDTGVDSLCLAGGVCLNCVANQKIKEKTPFKRIFIQPAAGDSGGALGAAAYIYFNLLNNQPDNLMVDAYLGPEFSAAQIKRVLVNNAVDFKEFEEASLCKYIAAKIYESKIIGWFQGRMEFGPRALGNRSILANPCNPDMKELLNKKVKDREPFRPYAPLVLEEKAADYFQMSGPSSFMLLAPQVRKDKVAVIPAVTHYDGSARVQTVNKNGNPKLWQLVKEFENLTGVPVIINTSFNLRGQPIVCSPEDALGSFQSSAMDILVLGNFVIEKS